MPKIKLGISRCLLGDCVRYDGKAHLDVFLRDGLQDLVDWFPVCPEVEFGMPVPREKITLYAPAAGSPNGGLELRTCSSNRDLTAAMHDFCARRAAELAGAGLAGFVFKGRSPSCGLGTAAVRDASGQDIGVGFGFFAAAWRTAYPQSLIIEAETLAAAEAQTAFRESLLHICRTKK